MQGLSKVEKLEDLRAKIEKIEKRPLLVDTTAKPTAAVPLSFVIPHGMLHEIFTDAPRNSGALLGFSLAAARELITAERPAVLYLQLISDTAETGLPYAPGLLSLGVDPDCLILIRAESIIELLWAAEEALVCRAVAVVIADIGTDHKALDFTASRRLGLRAAESEGTFLLLRYGLGRSVSAARLRWHVSPEISSETPFDARAPGDSRWRLKLEKGLWRGKANQEWLLSWTKNGFDIVDTPDTSRTAPATAIPRPLSAPLGHRLSQTA
jgi:protein ImuA